MGWTLVLIDLKISKPALMLEIVRWGEGVEVDGMNDEGSELEEIEEEAFYATQSK
jgi:hypothetical protein